MNREEQLKFADELIENIKAEIIFDITNRELPESWDGFELRQFISDKFKNSVFEMPPQRKKEYNNYVLVNNL